MDKNESIHPLDFAYTHSPPTLELAPPAKKPRKPPVSLSLPVKEAESVQPIPVPHHSYHIRRNAIANLSLKSCPPLTSSPSTYILSPLYSLPEFKVGSLSQQLPSAWPTDMVNEFCTPPSDRSFSLSVSSSLENASNDDNMDQQLVFEMDE